MINYKIEFELGSIRKSIFDLGLDRYFILITKYSKILRTLIDRWLTHSTLFIKPQFQTFNKSLTHMVWVNY